MTSSKPQEADNNQENSNYTPHLLKNYFQIEHNLTEYNKQKITTKRKKFDTYTFFRKHEKKFNHQTLI